MDEENLKQQIEYCTGLIDGEISNSDVLKENILEEEVFYEFINQRCMNNQFLASKLWKLSLSVIYQNWVEHD